jgi:ribosome-associated heat shock protein Hsp15
MNSVRIDKWLWAARFFKTRSLATRACELGRVLLNGQAAKPAREIHVGARLRITNDGGEFEVEVLGLSDLRGPAPIAQTLYSESPESIERRKQVAAERKAQQEWEVLPPTRPSKHDRRKIISFRERG